MRPVRVPSRQRFVESTFSLVHQHMMLFNLFPCNLSSQWISDELLVSFWDLCACHMWVIAFCDGTNSSNDNYDCPQQSLHHSATPLHVLCEFSAKEEVLWFLWHTARPWSGLPPIQGSQSLPLVLLVQTQSLVFDIIFFSSLSSPSERFREERASLWSMDVQFESLQWAQYSLEVVYMFQKGSHWESREFVAVTNCVK